MHLHFLRNMGRYETERHLYEVSAAVWIDSDGCASDRVGVITKRGRDVEVDGKGVANGEA